MTTRSEYRNACFRAKKNVLADKQLPLIEEIKVLMEPHQHWSNFSVEWDIMINKDKQLSIITPESNYDYAHNTLLEASLLFRKDIPFDDFDDRQMNIVNIIDSLMLDGVMTWGNYNKVWGIALDPVTKQFSTLLYKETKNQLDVTDEMIKASMKDADGSAFTSPKTETVLEANPMDVAQQKAFEEFLAKKYAK
jgi:hypothetical protein